MPDDLFSDLHDNQTPPMYRWFDGVKWTPSKNGNFIPVISPVDNSVIGKIPVVTHDEINVAIKRAHEAQKKWALVPIVKRCKVLHLAADWIREHESYLTTLLVKEIGKPADEAKDEIIRSADMVDYFANEALNLKGQQLPSDAFPGYEADKISIIERVPLGVILAIAPFNYPVNLSVSKLAPALATGNAVIFKPPTNGALSGLCLTEIFHKAGIPEGLLVTVTGGGADVGDFLTVHPGIDMITFTGSSQVGKYIAARAGMIPLLFECGGNNPAIVLNGCDLEATALEIVKGAYSFAGQRCTAIKYVLGLSSDLDKILPRVVALTN
jgi:glyceraldehyde-3-phosphate dehydrogenase (NADP+)